MATRLTKMSIGYYLSVRQSNFFLIEITSIQSLISPNVIMASSINLVYRKAPNFTSKLLFEHGFKRHKTHSRILRDKLLFIKNFMVYS